MEIDGTIDKIRFIKQKTINGEQVMQKGWYREVIHNFGVDIQYLRRDLDFFKENPESDLLYGEAPTAAYNVGNNLIAFLSVSSDAALLSTFGFETTFTTSMFILKDDYVEAFSDDVGLELTEDITMDISRIVKRDGSVFIYGEYISDNIKLYIEEPLLEEPALNSTSPLDIKPVRLPELFNQLIAVSDSYTDQEISGRLTGDMVVDAVGTITGTLTGTISFKSKKLPANLAPNWGIAPQPGDIIRLVEFSSTDENYEEYTVGTVNDRDLSSSGINPILEKYVWKCELTRRMPSHEDITVAQTDVNGNPIIDTEVSFDDDGFIVETPVERMTQEERMTPDTIITDEDGEQTTFQKLIKKEMSNEQFDYDAESVDEIDDENSDDVYGGF